ncbi:hypothetical protein ABIC75_001872 [Dyella japonica]|uniref:Uncharacterized protein n=1 Tax=Dyella japonica TaxID=231455 RepID=A0ABV2JV24_9GAMM
MEGGGCSQQRLGAGLSGALRCGFHVAGLASPKRSEAVA